MGQPAVRLSDWDGSAEQLQQAADLYADVFAEPPYGEDRAASIADLTGRVRRDVDARPSARLLLAWAGTDVVGLAFGASAGSGDFWRDTVAARVSAAVRDEWIRTSCFFVAELAVRADQRGTGIAAALMDDLLRDAPDETAVLTCWESGDAARAFYRATGWQDVAGLQVGESTELRLLARRLRPTR